MEEQMRYKQNRGGHAPGHLREAFIESLYNDDPMVEVDDIQRSIEWLCGQLWNCSDIMPGEDCDAIELPQGSTYAKAARKILWERKYASSPAE
jgi:hypothetical protein